MIKFKGLPPHQNKQKNKLKKKKCICIVYVHLCGSDVSFSVLEILSEEISLRLNETILRGIKNAIMGGKKTVQLKYCVRYKHS